MIKKNYFGFVFVISFFLLSELSAQENVARKVGVGGEENTATSEDDGQEEGCCEDEMISFGDEEWLERMKNTVRDLGYDEEWIERLEDDYLEFIVSEEVPSKTPENIRIERGLKVIEKLLPELIGLAKKWKDTQSAVEVFPSLIVGMAQHHKLSDLGAKKMSSTINHFVDLATQYKADKLEMGTLHYVSFFVQFYAFLREEELSTMEMDRDELFKIRTELLSTDFQKKNTKKIDRFLSCVESIENRADREFTKLFSRLIKILEKTVTLTNSMEDDESKIKRIDLAIEQIIQEAPKIMNTTDKISAQNCYWKVDVDLIKSDYQEFIGEKNE